MLDERAEAKCRKRSSSFDVHIETHLWVCESAVVAHAHRSAFLEHDSRVGKPDGSTSDAKVRIGIEVLQSAFERSRSKEIQNACRRVHFGGVFAAPHGVRDLEV